jgi:hypothetical protein
MTISINPSESLALCPRCGETIEAHSAEWLTESLASGDCHEPSEFPNSSIAYAIKPYCKECAGIVLR